MPKEITKELLRQVEITASVYESPGKYSEHDMADRYNCSVQSIRRDFVKIRSEGVSIHSSKGKLYIENKIKLNKLNQLISLYLALNENDLIRNLGPITRKYGNKTFSIFVRIIKAINEKRKLSIEYGITSYGDPIKRVVTPIGFNKVAHTFNLIALENDVQDNVKFFLFERIISVKFNKEKSSLKVFPNLYDIYRFSWSNYTGIKESSNVELLFDKKHKKYLKDKIFVQEQEVIDVPEGILLKLKVKISFEFISWVMGWGGDVKVIKPSKLKKDILEKSNSILRLYS